MATRKTPTKVQGVARISELAMYARMPGSGRIGTLHATRAQLVALLGSPNTHASAGGKVSAGWALEVDARPVHLYRYWWNARDEWSIGGQDTEAAVRLAQAIGAAVELQGAQHG
jgi:hypothetical protein